MKFAHFSDTHGYLSALSFPSDVEGLICTGDFFPNKTRGDASVEIPFQMEWFERNVQTIFKLFRGLPIACVDGNHDFVSLADLLVAFGYSGKVVHVNSSESKEFFGFKIAGFREIPWISGEWNGETSGEEMQRISSLALETGCEILLTHTPPAGILSGKYGCQALSSALAYIPHNVRLHCFGHNHWNIGQTEAMGIEFSNAATSVNLINLS